MFSSEIKETTFLALSAFLLSALFGFIIYLADLRADFAAVRNREVHASQSMAGYREFNKYNGATLYGEDVVAAIRDFYDSDIRIRVNNDWNGVSYGSVYTIDKYLARQNPSLVDIAYLQSLFPTERKYQAVLVYGQVDLSQVTFDWREENVNSGVSAIVFFHVGSR